MSDYNVKEIMVVIRAMTNQMMRPRIKFVSKLCGLSEKKFTKKFFELYGHLPELMIDMLLVKKSVKDLIGSSMSVKEIAKLYKFKSTSEYSNMFLNLYRVTPEEYRHMYVSSDKFKKMHDEDEEFTKEVQDLLDSLD